MSEPKCANKGFYASRYVALSGKSEPEKGEKHVHMEGVSSIRSSISLTKQNRALVWKRVDNALGVTAQWGDEVATRMM